MVYLLKKAIRRIKSQNEYRGDNMPLICLEGASAVGKTTTSNELAKRTNAFIIPEVNLLFERPVVEVKTWYLERQIDRWLIAQEKLKTYDTVILDGDIFQPLGYNWCFDFNIYNQSLDFIAGFYRNEIKEGRVGFPDKYFYLYTNQVSLENRKESDITRKRGNFEKHLEIVEPHQRYYEALNYFIPDYVQLIKAESIQGNIKSITDSVSSYPISFDSIELLDNVTRWLANNKA